MANHTVIYDTITLSGYGTVNGAVTGRISTKKVATTTNNIFTATFSSLTRATSSTNYPANYNINNFLPPSGSPKSERGELRGRRPHRGLLFPRGVYGR